MVFIQLLPWPHKDFIGKLVSGSLTKPRNNPFKFGRGTILSVGESRKFDRTCKAQPRKKFKQDLEQCKEEDLKNALRKGAELVSYQET